MSQHPPNRDIESLISREAIARRVGELGAQISEDYRGRSPHVVGILKGAWVFMADLIRVLDLQVTVDFLGIASYGLGVESSGEVKIIKDLEVPIEGMDVLVVEDILDSGRTLKFLKEVLEARKPRSLRVVTLLDKASRRVAPVQADYVGFTIPDAFVVGYGLDFDQQYRQLPEVYVLRSIPSR
jgi:hypoxanthine phosphoribosyltransferase